MFGYDNRREIRESYLECIKPFIKIKCDINAITLPIITIDADGGIRHEYKYTPAQEMILKQVDEAIGMVQRQHEKMIKEVSGTNLSLRPDPPKETP